MELEIYNKPYKSTFLKLCKRSNNDIQLEIVDEYGHRRPRGTILSIDSEGLHLKRSVNKDFGFLLDKNGAISVSIVEEA